jgi:hypothetical protein
MSSESKAMSISQTQVVELREFWKSVYINAVRAGRTSLDALTIADIGTKNYLTALSSSSHILAEPKPSFPPEVDTLSTNLARPGGITCLCGEPKESHVDYGGKIPHNFGGSTRISNLEYRNSGLVANNDALRKQYEQIVKYVAKLKTNLEQANSLISKLRPTSDYGIDDDEAEFDTEPDEPLQADKGPASILEG